MASTVPEQPPSERYQPGELVNVRITGARYEGVGLIGEHAVRVDDQVFDLPLNAVIERVAPKEWPPQPGDIWEDLAGHEWFARAEGDFDVEGAALVQVDAPGSGQLADWVANAFGPLRLVRRRGWTPEPAPAEPTPVELDQRAEKVAGLRAFADLLASRTDLPLPYGIDGQVGFQGEEGLARASELASSFGVEMGAPRYTGDRMQRWARSGKVDLGGGVTLTLYAHGLDAPIPVEDIEIPGRFSATDPPYRCEGCGKTSRLAAHLPGCPVAAAWDAEQAARNGEVES